MSAFIVSRECMQRAVQTIAAHHHPNIKPGDLTRLGQTLFLLNADAFNQRYDCTVEAPDFEYSPDSGWTPAIGLKALRCLLYQCAEGDVPDTQLYKCIEATAESLALVPGKPDPLGYRPPMRDSLEYERAPWG